MTLSPEREAALLALVPGDAVSLLDEDGLVLDVSADVEKVLGYTPEQYTRARAARHRCTRPTRRMLLRELARPASPSPGRRSIVEARLAPS